MEGTQKQEEGKASLGGTGNSQLLSSLISAEAFEPPSAKRHVGIAATIILAKINKTHVETIFRQV